MELKNAVAVCLISLFSATLVLLIARALDMQAASKLEPQLKQIAEELEAIRKAGGIAAGPGAATTGEASEDALMVYYFHGVRCPTCRAAEANAKAAIDAEYVSQLNDGTVAWKVLDYMNDPKAKSMAVDFGVTSATIVLVKMKDGEMDSWNRLDKVLSLAKDKPAMKEYLQTEIQAMLEPTPPTDAADVDDSEVPPPTDIPVPSLPVPEAESGDTESSPPLPLPMESDPSAVQ